MNTQKRVIDASKMWNGGVSRTPVQQKPPVRVVPQQTYSVGVNPNANIVYQQPPKKTVPQVVQAVPVKKESQVPTYVDPEMKLFDTTGCTTIEEVYQKNSNIIKIVPE